MRSNHVCVLILLSLSVLLSISTWLASSVVSAYLAKSYGVAESQSSLLTVAAQTGFMASAALQAGTMLPDRVNCRHLMASGAVLAAVANLLLLLVPTFGLALACRTLTGMSMALIYPPSTKVLATWFVENRGLAMSFLVGSIAPGTALPSLVKALPLGDLWQTRDGFVLLTVSTSVLSLVGGAIPLLLRDGPHPFPRSKTFSCRLIPRLLGTSRGATLAICAYSGHMWELYAVWSSLPLFLEAALSARGYAAPEAATLAAGLSCAAISLGGVSCVCIGLLAQRWGRVGVCLLCTAISGACSLAAGSVAAAAPPAAAITLLVVWGLAVVPDSPQYTTLVLELVDPSLAGTALVLQQCVGYLATIPMIFAIPVLASAPHVGWRYAFSVLDAGALVALLALVRLHGVLRGRRAAPLLTGSEASTATMVQPAGADSAAMEHLAEESTVQHESGEADAEHRHTGITTC